MLYNPDDVSYKIVILKDGSWTTVDGNDEEIRNGEVVELSKFQDENGVLKGICERRTFVEYTMNSPGLVCRGNYCRWI